MVKSRVPSESELYAIKCRFDYDKDTGYLYSTYANGASRRIIKTSFGYIKATVNGRDYNAHLIGWYLYYGEWPQSIVDHINGVRYDNRIANLRLVTDRQSSQNADKRTVNSFHGVNLVKGKWRYRVIVQGKAYEKRCYPNELEAVIARELLLDKLGDEFAKRNFLF